MTVPLLIRIWMMLMALTRHSTLKMLIFQIQTPLLPLPRLTAEMEEVNTSEQRYVQSENLAPKVVLWKAVAAAVVIATTNTKMTLTQTLTGV